MPRETGSRISPQTVYVETSVISYLTARPSKTIVGAAHQQLTLAWWTQRSQYDFLSRAQSGRNALLVTLMPRENDLPHLMEYPHSPCRKK